jgi:hypothetical protein
MMARAENPAAFNGIRGWLILAGGALALSVVRTGVILAYVLWPAFSSEIWYAVAPPGAPAYHAMWKPMLVGELVGNSIALAAGAFVLILFLLRR